MVIDHEMVCISQEGSRHRVICRVCEKSADEVLRDFDRMQVEYWKALEVLRQISDVFADCIYDQDQINGRIGMLLDKWNDPEKFRSGRHGDTTLD